MGMRLFAAPTSIEPGFMQTARIRRILKGIGLKSCTTGVAHRTNSAAMCRKRHAVSDAGEIRSESVAAGSTMKNEEIVRTG